MVQQPTPEKQGPRDREKVKTIKETFKRTTGEKMTKKDLKKLERNPPKSLSQLEKRLEKRK